MCSKSAENKLQGIQNCAIEPLTIVIVICTETDQDQLPYLYSLRVHYSQ